MAQQIILEDEPEHQREHDDEDVDVYELDIDLPTVPGFEELAPEDADEYEYDEERLRELTEEDGVVIIPLQEWERMNKKLDKILARMSLLQKGGISAPTILRRETTEIITKKTIEERIHDEDDENAGLWFACQMELKTKLGKQLKKVQEAIQEEQQDQQKKNKNKSRKKKKNKKQKKEIPVHAR